MFCDGNKVYKKFNKNYIKHKKGYVIIGPPGIGKTTFVQNQKGKKRWIDQDDLYNELGVKWHFNEKDRKNCKLNYMRADYISEQSKSYGYRLIGALYWDYKADAIVIPELKKHKEFVLKRNKENKFPLELKMVMNIRKDCYNKAKKYKIPIFKTILEAVEYLENKN